MPALLGFVPDAPINTPGVMTDVSDMIPTDTGFESAPAAIDVVGLAALASSCRGGAVVENTLGVRRFFAGTQTKLFEYVSGAWSDVARVGNYTGSSDSRWSFAQFGEFAIASDGVAPIQATSSGDFADIATAPAARIVVSVANFVMALNTVDGTYGTRGDAWWCSGIFDHTAWTPSLSTQANTGRLVSAGGAITAGLAFGQQVVAYKARSMFLGAYVGGDAVWDWQQVHGEAGCAGIDAVCDAGGAHVFVGEDNIWIYDGVRPRPLADGVVRQWWIANSSPVHRSRTIATYDRQNNRVWIFFPSQGSTTGTPDRALVYHMVTGRWGRADREIQAAVTFAEPGVTFDTLDSVGATFDTLPNVSFDSQFWTAGSRSLAVFSTSNKLQTLTGASNGGSFTCWDMGSDVQVTYLDLATISFNKAPSSSTCGGVTRRVSGGETVLGSAATLRDGQYQLRQSGRWHSLTFNFYGPVTVVSVDVRMKPAGMR